MNFAAAGNSGGGGSAAGRGDLRQLLRANLPDPAAVRAEIRTVRAAGIDPGIPPEFFHRLGLTGLAAAVEGALRSGGIPALGVR